MTTSATPPDFLFPFLFCQHSPYPLLDAQTLGSVLGEDVPHHLLSLFKAPALRL